MVVVVGGMVVVVVDDVVLELVLGGSVGAGVRAGVAVVTAPGDGDEVTTGLAAVPPNELVADARATTTTPATPITQLRLAIASFSPLGHPDLRHPGLSALHAHAPPDGRPTSGRASAAVDTPRQTPTPVGIPTTGLPTEHQAQVAARNIAAQIKAEQPKDHGEFGTSPAACVMDAGNNGVIIMADHLMPPRKHGVLIPGPQAHALKLGFEQYFM